MGRVELWGIQLPCLLLMASRPIIHQTELLMDYKLDPDDHDLLPDWYESYDSENARRRWDEQIERKRPPPQQQTIRKKKNNNNHGE